MTHRAENHSARWVFFHNPIDFYNIICYIVFRKEVPVMAFPISSALLDAVVLSVVSQQEEGTYGYKITQEVTQELDLSESTLYPVLRRLQKDGCLTVYDAPVNGRNRRYYKITPAGQQQLSAYKEEWIRYRAGIDRIFQKGE